MKRFKRVLACILTVSMVICLMPASAFAADGDSADIIKYSGSADKVLNFDKEDFNEACDEVSGEELDYIKFSLPIDEEGVLYYDYDDDKDADDQTLVATTKKYYYSETPKLSSVSFVPDKDFEGSLTINYKGYDVDGAYFYGEIKITVEGSENLIKYSADEQEVVNFDEDDFSKVCDDIQNEDLDYIKFSLPDSDDGILYYDYDEDDDSNVKVSTSKKYYLDAETPYIKKVSFVPEDDFSGKVTITYTGYDTAGDSFTGKVQITVGDSSSSTSKTVSYTVNESSKIAAFDEDDFNKISKSINDEDLDYITMTVPSASKGNLYYEYSGGNYTSVVSSGKKYYMEDSPYIKKITFVPASSFTGICKIDFKGYDTEGNSFTGVISITVGSSSATSAKLITYSGAPNTAVLFKDEDFNSVCKSLTGTQLSYVQFTLPASSYGTIYYGYTSSTSYTAKAKEDTKYYYGGAPYLLNVSFVPASGVTGSVTLTYTGYDTSGVSYTGKVQINVGSTSSWGGITLVSSKYFNDVDISYSWAVPYIDSLYEQGVIAGTSSGTGTKLYSPASYITRGDFMYLLYKALNFKTTSTTTNFEDVPSGSYYYNAILTAKALGITQGAYNKFNPNERITREDAMVMVLRAVNITGKTIASGDTSSLSKYSDGSLVSDYSKSAVAALIKAGVITGSDDNKIYPQGNLTRAQIAAIIYRVKNL